MRGGKIRMDGGKIQDIIDWEPPTKVWDWNEHCSKAVDQVKQVMTKEHVLALPDYTKSYEMEDESGKANATADALS
ncbi:Retrotransposable element Tf2 [Gossypium australe]|uniref:Retrotransposable element Tf2 n=1 Tax=Gossypium australe TaxID=47621 RepID=A0A5B6UWJ5_9ROSI|nr:Retrotransposable element Tf2 [Gossypium australe]